MNLLGFIGVLLGVGILIYLTCFRRMNLLLASLIGVLIIIAFNSLPVWETITATYANGIGGWVEDFLVVFTMGALLGQALQSTGSAQAIGESLVNRLGIRHAGLIIHILSLLIVFAGVDFIVACLSIAPISIAIVRKANLPRRFAIACLLGGGCSYVFSLPGASTVNNLLPIDLLGTTTLAAWLPGLLGGIVSMALVLLYQRYLEKKFRRENIGFDLSDEEVERDFGCRDRSQLPPAWIGCTALLMVILSSVLLGGTNIVAPKAAISGGLAVATVFTLALGRKYLREPVQQVLGTGAADGIMGAIVMGAVIGFVAVVQNTQAFMSFAHWTSTIQLPPLLSVVFTIQMMNIILANSPGSMSILMNSFSAQLLAGGVQPAVLHRVAAMSSVSFAAMMPHNPGSLVCFQTYKASYGKSFIDIVFLCIVAPLIGVLAAVALISAGIV